MKHFYLLLAAVLLVLFCAGCSSAQGASSAGGPPDVTASINQPDSTSDAPDGETEQSTAMSEKNIEDAENKSIEEEETEMRIKIQVNGSTFYAVPEENEAVRALVELMEQAPVTIMMSDMPGLKRSARWDRACPQATARPPPRPGTSSCITGIKS